MTAGMTASLLRSRTVAGVLACCGIFATWESAQAQVGFGFARAVGGVAVDADGVLSAPTVEDERGLEQVRLQAARDVPADLQRYVDLRAVSLRALEAELAAARQAGRPAPDHVQYLAGLLRVQYVLAYPERNDIVLAGPAEGWKFDQWGTAVGATTNRPVLRLDDLIVALRSGAATRLEPISCSIDPTPEGLRQVQETIARLRSIGDPAETMSRIEEALGPQTITVTGVPGDSHFARAMVAADFRMKRLAMHFEPAPIDGLPSFLEMTSAAGRGMHDMMPRWWLAPKYAPLAKSADGLAWELRGPGVQCLTEEQYVNARGEKTGSGRAHPAAAKWAAALTERFEELANHDSAFGTLRNVIDLAVVGALLEQERLLERAALDLPLLLSDAALGAYPVPRSTASRASFVKQGRNWVISASGGVQILPWNLTQSFQQEDSLPSLREGLAGAVGRLWWE